MQTTIQVKSDNHPTRAYTVTQVDGRARACTCPHHVHRRAHCKHMRRADQRAAFLRAARVLIARGVFEDSADFLARYEESVDACGVDRTIARIIAAAAE